MTIKELANLQLRVEDVTLKAMLDLKTDLAEECVKIWDTFRFGKLTLDIATAKMNEIEDKLAA